MQLCILLSCLLMGEIVENLYIIELVKNNSVLSRIATCYHYYSLAKALRMPSRVCVS